MTFLVPLRSASGLSLHFYAAALHFFLYGFHMISFIWNSLYKHFGVYGLSFSPNFAGNGVCEVFIIILSPS